MRAAPIVSFAGTPIGNLRELHEAFACQVVYRRDRINIDDEKPNVHGGAICRMCVAAGMGAAALFEVS